VKSDGVCTAQYKMLLFCVKPLERVLTCLKKKEKHFDIQEGVMLLDHFGWDHFEINQSMCGLFC